MGQQFDFAFVHGGGQGGWVWEETIAALELQTGGACRVLALDAPGCGAKRDRNTDDLTMDDVARELVADIEAAGVMDVILVGHSQAGQALPWMAELRPNLFRRLVYVTCSCPLVGQTIQQMMGREPHGSHPDEVGWPFDPAKATGAAGYPLMFCNDMGPAQSNAFLAKLGKDRWPPRTYAQSDWRYDHLGEVPASYVICLQDMCLPASWQETFADRLKVQRRVRIDAGHQVMNTRPHALAEIIRQEAENG